LIDSKPCTWRIRIAVDQISGKIECTSVSSSFIDAERISTGLANFTNEIKLLAIRLAETIKSGSEAIAQKVSEINLRNTVSRNALQDTKEDTNKTLLFESDNNNEVQLLEQDRSEDLVNVIERSFVICDTDVRVNHPDERKVKDIMALGFSRDDAIEALRECNDDANEAAHQLLMR